MHGLPEGQLLLFLVALSTLVFAARAGGEIARRLQQPEVLGELLAGFLLGPSVLGALAPGTYHLLFVEGAVGMALPAFSWVGAILLLLIAGLEVDLDILRQEARPGTLAAGLAILSAVASGTLYSHWGMGASFSESFFLGIVLSVTAVGVLAKVLIERQVLRRRYAQVTLSAGVAAEVGVWLLVSVAAATHGKISWWGVARSAFFAVAFFWLALSVGRRIIFWAMRQVADATTVAHGQLSLVLVLTFLTAALTELAGLHALLGAFVFGVLLSRAPRARRPLLESLESLNGSLFAPVFFVLAGMRVNVLELRTPALWGQVLVLLVLATVVKIGAGALGAKLGGMSLWESALVGTGLNVKGGTDVVVAIVGVELGLLSPSAYTAYAVVAIATVLFSPALLQWLASKAPPSPAEEQRLAHEEAKRRSYAPRMEHVLLPMLPTLLPETTGPFIRAVGVAKAKVNEIFDVAEVLAAGLQTAKPLHFLVEAAEGHDLVALGAPLPGRLSTLSFGRLQDAVLNAAQADVLLLAVPPSGFELGSVRRILVPVTGLEYSMAAADLAAYLALALGVPLTLWHAAQVQEGFPFVRARDLQRHVSAADNVLKEVAFRLGRLGVQVELQSRISASPGKEILKELRSKPYGLVVMGALNRATSGRPSLGNAVETVLTRGQVPTALLVSHELP